MLKGGQAMEWGQGRIPRRGPGDFVEAGAICEISV